MKEERKTKRCAVIVLPHGLSGREIGLSTRNFDPSTESFRPRARAGAAGTGR